MTVCKNTVTVYSPRGREMKVKCGRTFNGEFRMCESCLAEAEKAYPQGWEHYPGDICEHGVYVGGCGIDWMCPICEGI